MQPPAFETPTQRKHIVICADGTGNTAIKGRGTNVFKIYETVDQAGHRLYPRENLTPQVAIYHDGVGTENVKWLRILTGAFGWGISRNVKQLYGELARAYRPGDKIFLFGFSRGAFTVRTLAGLIHACGVLDLDKYGTSNKTFDDAVRRAYKAYRRHYQTWLASLFARREELNDETIKALRDEFSVAIPEFDGRAPGEKLIEFMGVWDTVDAVGLPFHISDFINAVIYRFKFHDRTLNLSVARACHALALDEERQSFAPVLWDESKTEHPERLSQVWFAGVHSNVGGGYPRQGMSLTALDWMMHEAKKHHLRFVPSEELLYGYHGDADDKLYDPRAGLGVFYRWKPRDVQALCNENGVTPKLHRSVFERISRNTEGYAPGSVPPDPVIVSASASPEITDRIRRLVRDQHADDIPLIRREAGTVTLGSWSYWLFVLAVIVLAGFTIKSLFNDTSAGTWYKHVGVVATTAMSWKGVGALLRTLGSHWWLTAWLAVSLVLGLIVDQRLDATYSEFWQRNQLRLELRRLMYPSESREELRT